MKIYKQTIATGKEWKPCCHCDKRFVIGEVLTALSDDEGNCCQYWYCSKCFERFWFAPLPAPVERDDDIQLVVINNNKLTFCPKPMAPEEYMARNEFQKHSSIVNRNS